MENLEETSSINIYNILEPLFGIFSGVALRRCGGRFGIFVGIVLGLLLGPVLGEHGGMNGDTSINPNTILWRFPEMMVPQIIQIRAFEY